MKQRIAGKKVINWHRPFRKSEKRRSYRRMVGQSQDKHAHALLHEELELILYDDYFWYDCDGYDYYDYASDLDYAIFRAIKLIGQHEDSRPFKELLSQLKIDDSNVPLQEAERPSFIDTWQPKQEGLEERLFAHLEQLTTYYRTPNWVPCGIMETARNRREIELLFEIYTTPDLEHLAVKLLLFSPFWTRPLSTWSPPQGNINEKVISLVNHLFVRYPVPRFLYKEWMQVPDATCIKWLYWFVLLGDGRNLKWAADRFEWRIGRKFQHLLDEIDANLPAMQACMLAEIRRLGGTDVEFERLRSVPAFVIDPTADSVQPGFFAFWQETVQWISRHRNELTDHQATLALVWAMHEFTELVHVPYLPFSWSGRGVRRVLELTYEYHRLLLSPFAHYTWQAHSWDWDWTDEEGQVWSFVELTTSLILYEESRAMHHCVSNYAGRCAAGYSAIVSLKLNSERRLTIEVQPRTKQLLQVYGAFNSLPSAQEKVIVESWREQIVLKDQPLITSKRSAG